MIVLGLGNPGPRYARTRHNAGFLVVEAVASLLHVRWSRVWLRPYAQGRWRDHYLAKPLAYMNRSGEVLKRILRRTGLGVPDVLVVYDNVDLPPGSCRAKTRGSGGGGHRGMESIHRALGTTDFPRVSVGVGRPPEGVGLADYVLEEPSPEEMGVFLRGVEAATRMVTAMLGVEVEGGTAPSVNPTSTRPC
jgi:PTH1 family peptidyl-tRNA hydrolase